MDRQARVPERLLVSGVLLDGAGDVDRIALKMSQRAVGKARADGAGEGKGHHSYLAAKAQKKRAAGVTRTALP